MGNSEVLTTGRTTREVSLLAFRLFSSSQGVELLGKASASLESARRIRTGGPRSTTSYGLGGGCLLKVQLREGQKIKMGQPQAEMRGFLGVITESALLAQQL